MYVFMYIIVYVSLLLIIQVKLQEYNIWKITLIKLIKINILFKN